ncbi:BlaI/MecI/CopY family transcriptional regulator [Aminipila butyrica]|uniref:BlaI/MecI/CopY family transcriptional regulator n=1 Tax=Aminipila butyrica TaxID=433296 RepID=A0A858BSE1_9FIRM|nr:BlaI/MecI/CopY family transcriptional regulator [Aminipila butyrica]QIB68891.1 BlaI/MecI/CopY family transcriptional regulator [Aminipila butyrica]
MTIFQKLSETEMEVMQIIWEYGDPITSSELLDIFAAKEGKEWKGQTMATFLARLVKKGVLTSIKKQGRTNIYLPRISPEEYRSKEAKSFLDTVYEGSVKNFLATLYDGKALTKNDVTELRRWFTEKAGEKNE